MKIDRKTLATGLTALALFWAFACDKPPGPGGKASIKGRIYVKDYNSAATAQVSEFFGAGENVYISYGEEKSASNNLKTDADGNFEFKYLRPGKYTVFVMSRDTSINLSGADAELPAKTNVTISGKKESVDLGTIIIFK